jgi:hypothetical protein
MDLLARVALAVALAGCVASEGDVFTSLEADGSIGGSGDGGVDAEPGCPSEPDCPLPPPGDVTVCGRVVDVADSQPLLVDAPEVRVFDLVELRLDPLNAIELAVVSPDDCGYFTASVDGTTGLFAITTGAPPPQPSGAYRRVSSVLTIAPGQVARTNAWVLRDATDEQWTSDAGNTISYAEAGSVLTIFYDPGQPAVGPLQGAPIAGVTLTTAGQPEDDADYFADGDPLTRASVSTAPSTTGANGSALLRAPGQLTIFSGDKSGCDFAEPQGVAIPGLLQVLEIAGTCN